jgi:hypothetical protein
MIMDNLKSEHMKKVKTHTHILEFLILMNYIVYMYMIVQMFFSIFSIVKYIVRYFTEYDLTNI